MYLDNAKEIAMAQAHFKTPGNTRQHWRSNGGAKWMACPGLHICFVPLFELGNTFYFLSFLDGHHRCFKISLPPYGIATYECFAPSCVTNPALDWQQCFMCVPLLPCHRYKCILFLPQNDAPSSIILTVTTDDGGRGPELALLDVSPHS